MENPMAISNAKIIKNLKIFIDEVSEDFNKRKKYIVSQQDFSRKRLLSFQVIIFLLINGIKKSLNVELMLFFEQIPISKLCSKQAFSKQRKKLKALFFHDLNDKLTESFYEHHSCIRWNGFRLLAVDGSTVPLPNTEEIRNTYDTTVNEENHTYPIARISALYDVLNGIAIKAMLHPYTVSEEAVVLQLLCDNDLEGSLLLFDRGYPSYWLMHELIKKKTHFVFRASSNAFGKVEKFLRSNEMDIITEIYPSYKSLKKLRNMQIDINKEKPLKVRLVKILLPTGETEVLTPNSASI